MSSPPATNIVSFPTPGTDGPAPASAPEPAPDSLIGQIRTLWRDRLAAAVAGAFDKLIDEFYEKAEHALERDTRDFWLQSKDRWPGQRRSIEEGFKKALWEAFTPKAEGPKTGAQFAAIESSWSELSLVEDGALEEDMRFTEIAGRIRHGADEELAQLDQRMEIVLGKEDLKAEDNPLSPANVCNAFRAALKDVELDLKIKVPVLRAFSDGVVPEANKLFREVNTLLKERGILPTIKYGSTKKPQTGAGPGAAGVRGDGQGQVIGSVTLPIVSGAPGGGGSMPVIGGMQVGMATFPAGTAGAMPAMPGVMPAGAGGAMPGGAGAAVAGLPAAGGDGGTGVAMAAGVPVAGGGGMAADPFAMLQQLLMMNIAAGRGPAIPDAGVPAGAPFAGGPAGVPGLATPATGAGFPTLDGAGMPGAGGIPGQAGGPQFPGGAGTAAPGGSPGSGFVGGFPGTGPVPDGTAATAGGLGGGPGVPWGGGQAGAGGTAAPGIGYPSGSGGGDAGVAGGGGPAGPYPGGGGGAAHGFDHAPPGTAPGGGPAGGPPGGPYPGGGGGTGYGVGGAPAGTAAGGGHPGGGPGGPGLTGGGGGYGGSGTAAGGGYSPPGPGGAGPGTEAGGPAWPGGSGGGPAGGTGGAAGGGYPGGGAGFGPGGGAPAGGRAGTGQHAVAFSGENAGALGAPGTGSPGGLAGPGGPGARHSTGGGGAPGMVVTPPGFQPPPSDGGGFPALDPGVAGHSAGDMPGGAPSSSAYPVLNALGGAGLIGSLTRLQQGDMGALPDMPAEVREWLSQAPASATANLPIQQPRNVLQALKQTSLAQQFGQMDTVTLDIVAMLFDQIFGDPRVPPAMKALIGRLQIPMLKVAVLDKTFFSRKSHPARHMLDTLGELSLGLGEGFGPSSTLYQQIEKALSELVEQFEEDFGVFDRMTARFEAMLSELNGEAVAVAKVEEKRIQDRERLEVARLFAQNELRTRIAGHALPKAVLRFLSTDWMKLLILAYAKGGRESRAWHSLLETLDILVWSLTPKLTVDERKRLVSLLPGLLKRLAKGMEVVGTDRFMRERFNAVLMRCHARTIAGASAVGGGPTGATMRTHVPVARPAPKPEVPRSPTGELPIPKVVDETTPPVTTAPEPRHEVAQRNVPATLPVDIELEPTITPGLPGSVAGTDGVTAGIEPADGTAHPSDAPRPFGAGAGSVPDLLVEEVAFDPSTAPEMHDITAPMRDDGTVPRLPTSQSPEITVLQTGGAAPLQEEMAPAEVPASFPTVTVKNPFGDGEIEVEEVSFNDLPGFASPMSTHVPPPPADEFVAKANAMKEGDWVELHQEGKEMMQARLSLVSPYRSTFVFSNRKGQKVAEYSLYQVTSYLRSGRMTVLEDIPLFDRAFGNLVNILRKGAEAA